MNTEKKEYKNGQEPSDPHWSCLYKTTEEYYINTYDPKYFSFSRMELEVDPSEVIEDLDRYVDDPAKQRLEIIKCHDSFSYFCHKYVKIGHPKKGMLPFILYNYQKRVVDEYDKKRFNIIRKFRQGGLTTVTVLWALWRCMFKMDQTIMLVSKTDREAIVAGEIADRAIKFFPKWFCPELAAGGDNKHEKHFAETQSKLLFYTAEAARGRSNTYLILDEAAFIKDMERHWAALFPTIATGGACIAVSTVNGIGNWYHEQFKGAQEKKNHWNILDLNYKEHPEYDDDFWVEQMKAQLGLKRFMQEVMGDFLGSGVTFIPPAVIDKLERHTKNITPIRKLYPQWQNTETGEISREFVLTEKQGALWIYKEPVAGREYIMAVDPAEGVGEEGDNSCAQVIDKDTMEQVAEFYSQECPTDSFSKVVERLGIYYNNALVVIESMGPGVAVLSKLANEYYYENLYYESVRNLEKPGIKMGRGNRPAVLEALQNRILNETMDINSIRLVHELGTFIWSRQKQRAEAQNGYHDDAIMAMALAVYVRDKEIRNIPVGGEIPKELNEVFTNDLYLQIKDELLSGAPEDWMDPTERSSLRSKDDDDDVFEEFYAKYRTGDRLLREFGF